RGDGRASCPCKRGDSARVYRPVRRGAGQAFRPRSAGAIGDYPDRSGDSPGDWPRPLRSRGARADRGARDVRDGADGLNGRPELIHRIRAWIEGHGPMTFDRFMEMALYEPDLGYYASLSPGATGESGALADFQTSPQVHPAFGNLVARYVLKVWRALERPAPFVVVELGAGGGELAGQV